MNKKLLLGLAVVAALLAFGGGYLHSLDPEVPFGYKVAHLIVHVVFRLTGVLGDTHLAAGQPMPNRWMWDLFFPEVPAHNTSSFTVTDTYVSESNVSVRLFVPTGSKKPHPLVVLIHGGGFVIGSAREPVVDSRSRWLAEAGIAVMSVKYRFAPEHPFPAAVDDAWAATRFALSGGLSDLVDLNRISVMGESAGANLAGVVSLLAKEEKAQGKLDHIPAWQICLFPAFWLRERGKEWAYPGTPFILTENIMQAFEELYILGDAANQLFQEKPYLVNPTKHPNGLAGMPAAVIVTGGKDVLQNEGKAYAAMLRAANLTVVHTHLPQTLHAFALDGTDPEHYPTIQHVIKTIQQ